MACCNSCNSCNSCSCNNCNNNCNNRVFTRLGGLGLFGRRFPLGGISYTYANCGCNDSCNDSCNGCNNDCGCNDNSCGCDCGCGYSYDPGCNECAYCGQDY